MRAHRDFRVRGQAASAIGWPALAVIALGAAYRAAVAQPPGMETAPRSEISTPAAAEGRSFSARPPQGGSQSLRPPAAASRAANPAVGSPIPPPEAAEPVPAAPPRDAAGEAGPRLHRIPVSRPDNDQVILRQQQGRLSLIVRDAPLGDVLTRLAETQGLNLVTAESLDARLTITLDQVTVDQALDAILPVAGFIWVRHQDIIFVTSLAQGNGAAPHTQGRQCQLLHLDFVSATDLQSVVTGMLSPVGKSYILESKADDNRRTQEALVVEDVPQYLERIRDYVAQVDQPPRQVLIEAHVLQIELNDETWHGVNLERAFELFNKDLTLKTEGFAKPGASPAFSVRIDGGDLHALLQCLKNTTDAKTLAAPRVLVLNGQTARIQVGERIGYRVVTTTETMTTESVDFLEVGIMLEVTPRISRDGRVLMQVKPKVSSGMVNPVTRLPDEETTEVQTNVMLQDGEGIVIGGLIKEVHNDSQSKIPWLGDVRWIGKLFRYKEAAKRRAELVVALVPRVMPYDPCYQQQEEVDVARARTPLFWGPLVPCPRPWEPVLPDAVLNPVRLFRLPPICDACPPAHCPPSAHEDALPDRQTPAPDDAANQVAPAAYSGNLAEAAGLPVPAFAGPPVSSSSVGVGHVEHRKP